MPGEITQDASYDRSLKTCWGDLLGAGNGGMLGRSAGRCQGMGGCWEICWVMSGNGGLRKKLSYSFL